MQCGAVKSRYNSGNKQRAERDGTSASLPLAAIISGLVMITWYWFAWLYYRYRKFIKPTLSTFVFDGALAALIVSSFGAWGVSVFQFTSVDSPLISTGLTHFFLSVLPKAGLYWEFLESSGISLKLKTLHLILTGYGSPYCLAPCWFFPLACQKV